MNQIQIIKQINSYFNKIKKIRIFYSDGYVLCYIIVHS